MARTEVRSAQIRDGVGVDLAVDVFGVLPIANGGTGTSNPAASAPSNFAVDGGNFSTVYSSTTFRIDFGSL